MPKGKPEKSVPTSKYVGDCSNCGLMLTVKDVTEEIDADYADCPRCGTRIVLQTYDFPDSIEPACETTTQTEGGHIV